MHRNRYAYQRFLRRPLTTSLYTEDEMDVSALNLGMIAAYYNISCTLPDSRGVLALTRHGVQTPLWKYSACLLKRKRSSKDS